MLFQNIVIALIPSIQQYAKCHFVNVINECYRKYLQCKANVHTMTYNNRICNRSSYDKNCHYKIVTGNIQLRFSKSMKQQLDFSKVPKLDEKDLEEHFVRGSGPGGQATNKTNNAVVLKHKPTGIVVKCHETRSVWDNKKRAREIMITKLDNLLNGDDSIEEQERRLNKINRIKKESKKKKLMELKKQFKEREGLT